MSDSDAKISMAAQSWRPAGNPWLIAGMVTLASFMEVLDTTVINVALPHIAGSMSASYDESVWAVTAYLVANSIVLMLSGFFTRLLGRKRYFLICIVMFCVASFLCGIATSLPQLIVFRLMQGFFGGGLQPTQQSIILDTFPLEKRAAAFGITASATIIAPVLGPLVGGIITDNYSWRWIFFINIPVGLISFLGVLALVEDPPWIKLASKMKTSIDYIGLGFIVLGLGALQIMLDQGENADWFNSSFIRLLAVLSAVGIVGAVYWLLSSRNPIVNLRVLANKNFAIGCVLIMAMSFIQYSSTVIMPQLTQQQFGYTAIWAGLVISPGAAALIFMIIMVIRIVPYVQSRYLIGFGFFLLSYACFTSSLLTPDIDFFNLAKYRVLQMTALSFLFVPISSIAFLTIPAELNSEATAMIAMFRNIAGSIGISISTSLIAIRTQVRMAYLGGHLSPQSQPYDDTLSAISQTIAARGATMAAAQKSAFGRLDLTLASQAHLLAYSDAFVFCAILAILVVPFTFLLSSVKAGGAARPSRR